MGCPSREGLRAGDPCISPALLCSPTADLTLETTVTCVQLSVGHQPQPQLSTNEVSIAGFFMIRTKLSQARPHGSGLEGHVTTQRTRLQDRGSRDMNRKVRTVCTDCDKFFGRAQELARHRKDVHERPRYCLFCSFKWTRPNNIKAHLVANHSEKFTAELLVTFRALRGRLIVAFLDAYN